MPNIPAKQQSKRKNQEQIVSIIAEKYRVSDRHVQLVIAGDRQNEEIFADYMFYKQEHNELLEKVKELVPF